ncbi:rhomboid family intramembrane serine protease [Pendulispora albinea]|uniref:Rhomboid family intramembrane serine protease n=1 Tax=Pendulispora albinea TaxID=2741071 RepID=A0ABZ2LQT6_9BACT
MERLLARLERRFGKFAIPNLTTFIVGGMAIVFVLATLDPRFIGSLTLDLQRVERGEVWRLFTYLFLPQSRSGLWVLFSMYWTWIIGSQLDSEWGAFKLNAYYLFGMLGTTAAAFISGGAQGNFYLNLSLTFAFATVFPDYEFYMFFVLRVKAKWLGIFLAALYGIRLVTGDWTERAAILASFTNYFLFFGGHLWGLSKQRNTVARQAARRTSFHSEAPRAVTGGRSCAICGAREDEDDADIRVCSCERCGGKPRNLCLVHAKNH